MKRLYRSRRDQILGGVAAGMADYFRVDPTLMRLLWILIGLTGGGILAYIIAWVIIPEEPAGATPPYAGTAAPNADQPAAASSPTGRPQRPSFEQRLEDDPERVLGWILVVVGGFFLLRNVAPWLSGHYLWPLIIVAIGVIIIIRGVGGGRR